MIVGVEANRAEIDAIIARLAKGWTIERMPAMDRLVMEIALYELGHRDDVPTAVVLNEAAELANTYSTDDSGRFVNGVLAAAAEELRRPCAPGDADRPASSTRSGTVDVDR